MKRLSRPVVIDTAALTDGELQFVAYKPADTSSLETCHETVSRALYTVSSSHAEAMRHGLRGQGIASYPHAPLSSHGGSVIRTVWHHGAQYKSYLVGPAALLLQHAALTDTEREQVMYQCRQAAASGQLTMVIATAITDHQPHQLREYHDGLPLEYHGLVIFEPVLYPRTIGAIEAIRQQGIAIYYVSADDELTVTALATAAHLTATEVAYPQTTHHATTPHTLMAHVVPHERARILATLGSVTSIDEPLASYLGY